MQYIRSCSKSNIANNETEMNYIQYKINQALGSSQYIELLKNAHLESGLIPENEDVVRGMLSHSNLTISAWHNDNLVGVARCITDFHSACCLTELGVLKNYINRNVTKTLLDLIKSQVGAKCTLVNCSPPLGQARKYLSNDQHNDQYNASAWAMNPD